ncbi:MAG: AraC family transcriptional regulator [Prolixibacteraceae bacterium]|jgi:AraC-like DNA-binding protein|nr:AraC family transcriptional regulator [Prolixibacteraceae bacterium]
MQPKLEKVPLHLTSSIYVKREITPYMDYPWHYHPEYEIIFVEKSYGIRLMGNHIGNFSDGDLMFIGSNLPHVWKNDNDFYQDNKDLMVDVYVIQFCENALGEGFFDLPEFIHIKKLFNHSQQGLVVKGDNHGEIAALIKKVYHTTGIERLVQFLKTVDAIANNTEYELLSSIGYANSITNIDTERINKIMSFLMENYRQDIDMDEIAALVNLNQSSFCRYFKSKTHKTCSQFLNEIRIAHACKLLINSNMSISEICYETGYNNISHFNRQFKLITSLTASGYAKKYLKNANLI